MSLTRKFLSALGIDEDKVDQIIEAHRTTVDAIKEERDNYKADAEKLSAVQKELDSLKKTADEDSQTPYYKAQYEAAVAEKEQLQKEFDQFKEAQAAKETKAKREAAARAYFKEQKINSDANLEIVMRGSRDEVNSLELDADGKIKDTKALDELINGVYSKFVSAEGEQGATVPNPPANNGGIINQPSRAAQMAAQFRAEHYGSKEE